METNLESVRDIQHGHIDESIVPGTVHLIDLDHNLHVKHSKAQQDIVLVPTPSDDPDDPVRIYLHLTNGNPSLNFILAQLVAPSQDSFTHLHVRLCLVHRNRQLCGLQRPGAAF